MTIKQKRNPNELLLLTILLLLGCMLVFARFIFGSELFLYFADANDDTFQSYLPLYQMMAAKLRDGDFSLMELSWGTGTNILSAQNFALDPFNLPLYILGALTDPFYVAFGLVYSQILRILCAGWACRWFLLRFELTPSSRIIASLAFSFSAFTIGGIGQHYYFASTLVMGVLFLGVIDRSFYSKRYLLLTSLFTAALCLFSVYLAYMVLLTAGIYALLRCLFDGTPNTFAKWLHTLVPLLAAVVIGVLLSAFLFLPTVYLMGGSSRFGGQLSLLKFLLPNSLNFYKGVFLRFFSETMEGTVNAWSGNSTAFAMPHLYMSGFLVACLPQHLASLRLEPPHIRRGMRIAYLLVLLSLGTLAIGTVYNAFVEYTSRFVFALMPFGAYCIAKAISNAQRRSFFSRSAAFFTTFLCALAFFLSFDGWKLLEVAHLFAVAAPLAALLFLWVVSRASSSQTNPFRTLLKTGSLLFVAVAVLVEGWTSLFYGRDTVDKEWYASTYNDLASQTIRQLKEESGNDLFRIEYSYHAWSDRSAFGNSMAQNYYGVSAYNSVLSQHYQDFRQYFCAPYQYYQSISSSYGLGHMGRPLDKTLADLYGLRYIFCYYPTEEPGWEQSGPYTNKNGSTFWILENPDVETMGITYYNWYSQESLSDISVLDRQIALANAVSLDQAAPLVPQTDATSFSRSDYVLDVGSLQLTQENVFEQGVEVSLQTVEQDVAPAEDSRLWLVFEAKTDRNASLNAAVDIGEGYYIYNWQNGIWQIDSESGWQEYVFPISATARSVLFYQETGSASTIELRNLHVVSTTGHNYTTTNSTMSCSGNSGLISGTVNMEMPGIFVLPICYDSGWSVLVDGSPATLLKADAAFLAVELPEGSHTVEFQYTSPGLKVGIIISLLGILFFICFVLSLKRRKFFF